MTAPTISVIMTVNDRPPDVLRAVLASFRWFPGNNYDELVIVNDRGDRAAIEAALADVRVADAVIVDIPGPPGRLCPAAAWNAGFAAATGSHFYCISSETVQTPLSVMRAREFAACLPEQIVFGRAEHAGLFYTWIAPDGKETRAMSKSSSPLPRGFVWVLPRVWLGRIDPPGYDPIYMGGFCYEDDDLMFRLFSAGATFLFCDDICGFHIEHGREFLVTDEGRAAVQRNGDIFVAKYGTREPMNDTGSRVVRFNGMLSLLTTNPDDIGTVYEAIDPLYQSLLGRFKG